VVRSNKLESMKELPALSAPRLVLRPFEPADAHDVQRLAGDRAIADTTRDIPHPYADGMAEEWIGTHRSAFEAGEAAVFAVVLRETAELTGAIGLTISRRFDNAELGYWIGRPYWGRGYCTEAATAILDYAFRDLGLHRVYASHLARNPASGRIMEKLGMTREGLRRQHVSKWGQYEDLVDFGILRDEWHTGGAMRASLRES
jgi:ribosomal-protein-alanine N-acetyltransferase